MTSRKYLGGQTPLVEVGADVFLGQRPQHIFGETLKQTAGMGHCRTDTDLW